MAAVATRETDVRLRSQPADDLGRPIGQSPDRLVRLGEAFLAEAGERRRVHPQPDHLTLGHETAARSVNFVYRRRKESLIESVGPLRCFARWISASPCWSDSSL